MPLAFIQTVGHSLEAVRGRFAKVAIQIQIGGTDHGNDGNKANFVAHMRELLRKLSRKKSAHFYQTHIFKVGLNHGVFVLTRSNWKNAQAIIIMLHSNWIMTIRLYTSAVIKNQLKRLEKNSYKFWLNVQNVDQTHFFTDTWNRISLHKNAASFRFASDSCHFRIKCWNIW